MKDSWIIISTLHVPKTFSSFQENIDIRTTSNDSDIMREIRRFLRTEMYGCFEDDFTPTNSDEEWIRQETADSAQCAISDNGIEWSEGEMVNPSDNFAIRKNGLHGFVFYLRGTTGDVVIGKHINDITKLLTKRQFWPKEYIEAAYLKYVEFVIKQRRSNSIKRAVGPETFEAIDKL